MAIKKTTPKKKTPVKSMSASKPTGNSKVVPTQYDREKRKQLVPIEYKNERSQGNLVPLEEMPKPKLVPIMDINSGRTSGNKTATPRASGNKTATARTLANKPGTKKKRY
jgi:hypothetical protein